MRQSNNKKSRDVTAFLYERLSRDDNLEGESYSIGNQKKLLTKVAIPSALPMIFTGLDVALGSAWTTLVAAELLASTKGLGFMIQQARGIFRLDIIIVGMIVIAITGAVLSSIIQFIGRKLIKGGRRG